MSLPTRRPPRSPTRLAAFLAVLAALATVPDAGQAAVPRKGAPSAAPGRSTVVALSSQPGTPLDGMARQLIARELVEAQRAGEQPLVLVGSAPVGAAGAPNAVFVQLQSPRECGSAGCSTSVYLRGRKVLDSVSGAIALDTARNKGVRDLVVGSGERYAWTGTEYANVRPAPAVNLRPRQPRRTQHTRHPPQPARH